MRCKQIRTDCPVSGPSNSDSNSNNEQLESLASSAMKDAAKPVHFLLYFFFISGCPHHSYGSMLSLCLFNKVVLVTLYFTPCTAATATRTGGQTPVRSGLDWKFVACCFLFASNKLVFVTVSITLSIVYTSAS